ncbi:MAG TPA: hypothetical protein ENK78_03965 [Thiothrix sp.]|nr:hypothetical protein [Thiothrix sp.]
MIEGIQPPILSLTTQPLQQNNVQLPNAAPADIKQFNTILEEAKSGSRDDLKIQTTNTANNDSHSIIEKVVNADEAYRTMLAQKQELQISLEPTPPEERIEPFKIRTVDDISDPNNNPFQEVLDKTKATFDKHLEQMRFVNDKIGNILAWSTNMTIFSSGLKSTSDGFKTLFRSSG